MREKSGAAMGRCLSLSTIGVDHVDIHIIINQLAEELLRSLLRLPRVRAVTIRRRQPDASASHRKRRSGGPDARRRMRECILGRTRALADGTILGGSAYASAAVKRHKAAGNVGDTCGADASPMDYADCAAREHG